LQILTYYLFLATPDNTCNSMEKKILILSIIVLLFSAHITGQKQETYVQEAFTDTIASQILKQIYLFPQEKIHLHIDKPHYISGEKIWLRAHSVNAHTHHPKILSRYIYVELINPMDSVVDRIKIKPENGLFFGYIPLAEDLPEGNYTIRAYTNFMRNLDNEYFFRKNIYVSDPLSASIRMNADFHYTDNNKKAEIDINFTDKKNSSAINPGKLKIQLSNNLPKQIKTDEDGIARFSFKILDKNKPKAILIDHDKHTKFIEIPAPEEDFEVSFFPEGGYSITNKASCIGFKALKSNGLSENITGEIYNENGEFITSIATLHKGIGIFNYIPHTGESYYAVCKNDKNITKRFQLPKSVDNTYVLKTTWRDKRLNVSVISGQEVSDSDLYLVVHSRGILQYAAKWDNSKEYLMFTRNSFPSGVIQILLLDANMNTISERLVFTKNDDQAEIRISPGKEKYKPREHIEIGIQLTDTNDNSIEGNFSVSVTDNKDIAIDTCSTILTTLLLTSDLKGYIEHPSFYFEDSKLSSLALDGLMLTQGWRRYNIPEVVKGKYIHPTEALEIGQEISGTVKGLIFTKAVAKSRITIVSPNASFFDVTETDDKGKFSFNGFELPDSTTYVIQALSKRGSKRVELILDKFTYPSEQNQFIPNNYALNSAENSEDYIAKADMKYVYENGMRMINLEEVVVEGTRIEKNHSMYEGLADNTLDSESIEKSGAVKVQDLLYRFAGVSVMGDKISIRGSQNPPLIVIDDVAMTEDFDLDFVNIFDIESLSIIKGAQAAIFGSRGGSGVILITTKTGEFTPPPSIQFNISTISPLGYQKPVEFYSPKYKTRQEINDSNPDLRTTIFWKPDIKTDESGNASFNFYSADGTTTYSVVIEGVTNNGKIFHKTGKILIE